MVIEMVLATDMKQHFHLVSRFRQLILHKALSDIEVSGNDSTRRTHSPLEIGILAAMNEMDFFLLGSTVPEQMEQCCALAACGSPDSHRAWETMVKCATL